MTHARDDGRRTYCPAGVLLPDSSMEEMIFKPGLTVDHKTVSDGVKT
jgi:hypothetical protein